MTDFLYFSLRMFAGSIFYTTFASNQDLNRRGDRKSPFLLPEGKQVRCNSITK